MSVKVIPKAQPATSVFSQRFLIPELLVILVFFTATSVQANSVCFGTTGNGKLENGVKLPLEGKNFKSYGSIPSLAGRTYVHSTVADIVLTAYEDLSKSRPQTIYVYGETGLKEGGEFRPHKTHQNGLSVDFMVPVLSPKGESIPLPTSLFNKWGYDIDFNSNGRTDGLQIDFEAIGAHLVSLHKAALAQGVDLWRTIFAPDLQDELYATSSGDYIRRHIKIPTKRSWVRHDDHYHVDFAISCKQID